LLATFRDFCGGTSLVFAEELSHTSAVSSVAARRFKMIEVSSEKNEPFAGG
jgi:hypothetical protein